MQKTCASLSLSAYVYVYVYVYVYAHTLRGSTQSQPASIATPGKNFGPSSAYFRARRRPAEADGPLMVASSTPVAWSTYMGFMGLWSSCGLLVIPT